MPEFLPNHVKSMITELKKEFNGNIEDNKNGVSFAIKGHVLALINECITISDPYLQSNGNKNNDQKLNARIKIMRQLENFVTELAQKTDEVIEQLSIEILEISTINQNDLDSQFIKLAKSKLIDLIINIIIPESDKLTPEEFNNPEYKKEHDYQQAIKNNLKRLLKIAMNETHKIDGLLDSQFGKLPFNTIENLSENLLRSLHPPLQTFTKILALEAGQAIMKNKPLENNHPQTNFAHTENKSRKNILSLSARHLFFYGPETPPSNGSNKASQTNLTTTNIRQ